MEYALGENPLEPSPPAITSALDGQNYLTLTYTRPADRTNAAHFLRSSGDLLNWETRSEVQALVEKTVNRDATETITLRDVVPAGETPRFLQLQVIQQ